MRVLVIGKDLNIFRENSDAYRRISEYAELFKEFHIISPAEHGVVSAAQNNLFLWPVRNFLPFGWLQIFFRAINIVRKNRIDVVDAQDSGEYGFLAFLVSLFSRIPLRLQIHTDIMSPFYRKASWKERVRYLISRLIIPKQNV
mgnify:FL=1